MTNHDDVVHRRGPGWKLPISPQTRPRQRFQVPNKTVTTLAADPCSSCRLLERSDAQRAFCEVNGWRISSLMLVLGVEGRRSATSGA